MFLTRRSLLLSTAALAAAPAMAQSGGTPLFTFADVVARADNLSRGDFDETSDRPPAALDRLDYDGYRNIRYRPEARLRLGAGFELDLFHRGHIFPRRVGVSILRDGELEAVPYDPKAFDFGGQKIGPFSPDLGFAGLRIRYPLNRPDVQDELIVFLGASYFRFLGRGQIYGLSARGLAINAGLPGEEEEFPLFREFWIEEAKPDARTLRLYALLDSPSVAGAYSFEIAPGEDSVVEVNAVLFPRRTIPKAGIAPLTSMYLTGGSGPRHIDMFRREVHDSDGLLMRRDGQASWRPLRNPRTSRTASFDATDVQGFGLMQRNRRFDDYQDLEAHYENRPSYYVEPVTPWSAGSIELSELATELEINDNIVASYRPASPLVAGERSEWRYRITATRQAAPGWRLARVQKTLLSDRAAVQQGKPAGGRLYIVDFVGGDLAFHKSALEALELTVQTSAGTVTAEPLVWNAHTNGVRARIFAEVDIDQTTNLSATLLHGGVPVSETWLAFWRRNIPVDQELASDMDVR